MICRWMLALLLFVFACPVAFAQEEGSGENADASEQPSAESGADEGQDESNTAEERTDTPDEPADGSDDQPETSDDPPEPGPKAKAWQAKLTEWKTVLSDLRDLREQYAIAKKEDLPKIREEYNTKLETGRTLLQELTDAGRAAFDEAPNEDRELVRFLVKLAADDVRAENYDSAFEQAKFLLDHECDDKRLYDVAGIAAFATNRMASAKEYLDAAQEAGVLSKEGGREAYELMKQHDLVKLWEEEEEFRAAEAKADDLPRVKLTTSKGDVVVELFENEAPDTVGNFISLVEKGFYDGRLFHRVLPGFMAQTGCPNGDGSGGPGYKIYCECKEEPYRKHFAGSLSMAKTPAINSGGSQFYLTFKPTPHLNGEHTVFGRVIDGWDVLAKIQRYNPSDKGPKPPLDKIEVAEVLRKRDTTDYKPNKVK